MIFLTGTGARPKSSIMQKPGYNFPSSPHCLVSLTHGWFPALQLMPLSAQTGVWQYCVAIWAAARQYQQNDLCARRRLRSAWASAQSDQSLRYIRSLNYLLSAQWRLWSDWSESSLGTHVILLVLSCGGSYCLCLWVRLLDGWLFGLHYNA